MGGTWRATWVVRRKGFTIVNQTATWLKLFGLNKIRIVSFSTPDGLVNPTAAKLAVRRTTARTTTSVLLQQRQQLYLERDHDGSNDGKNTQFTRRW